MRLNHCVCLTQAEVHVLRESNAEKEAQHGEQEAQHMRAIATKDAKIDAAMHEVEALQEASAAAVAQVEAVQRAMASAMETHTTELEAKHVAEMADFQQKGREYMEALRLARRLRL